MLFRPPLEQGYDYTEIDGKPVEWWQSYHRRAALRKKQPAEEAALSALIPEKALHQHVAMVGISSIEKRVTLILNSGSSIQFPPNAALPQRAPQTQTTAAQAQAPILVSRDIDAKGVQLLMSYYEGQGFLIPSGAIPFTTQKSQNPEWRDKFRDMWTAEFERRHGPLPAETAAQQIGPRPPVMRPAATSAGMAL